MTRRLHDAGADALAPGEPSRRAAAIIVGLLALLAAVLRLVGLGHSPPGLNQDEAINAWNAYCLLKTGRDMAGASWPVFYSHGFGGSPTVLLPYLVIPFQAIWGLGAATTRMAPAVCGALCVPLLYYVGSRLLGRSTGLVAAALLVVNPWHFALSRLAIDGSIVPFLTLVPLAAMLAVGLPLADARARARPAWAALAGIVSGVACYGYWAVRLYYPVFLALAVLATWGDWRRLLRTRAGLLTVLAFAVGLGATFGPLAYRHLTDPAIGERAAQTRLWEPGTPLPEIGRRLAVRYAVHFGPRFLFLRGDSDPGLAPADSGAFEWALLPLLLAGVSILSRRVRASASARVLAVMLLVSPAGDLLARYDGAHAMRGATGLPTLLLVAAMGAFGAWRWLARRRQALAWTVAGLLAVATLVQDVRSLAIYFGDWPRRPTVYYFYRTDLAEACAWVRPRFEAADAVFWTTWGMNMPFVSTLVELGYDPVRWASDPREVRTGPDGWDYWVRYGKNYFLYGTLCRPYGEAMQKDGRPQHVLFVVRPHELGLEHPVHVIRDGSGTESLWICEVEL